MSKHPMAEEWRRDRFQPVPCTDYVIADRMAAELDRQVGEIERLRAALEAQSVEATFPDKLNDRKWETERRAGAVTEHSAFVGGVLCRWWGDGEAPPGVAQIAALMEPSPPTAPPPGEIGEDTTRMLSRFVHRMRKDEYEDLRSNIIGRLRTEYERAELAEMLVKVRDGQVVAAEKQRDEAERAMNLLSNNLEVNNAIKNEFQQDCRLAHETIMKLRNQLSDLADALLRKT